MGSSLMEYSRRPGRLKYQDRKPYTEYQYNTKIAEYRIYPPTEFEFASPR